MRLLFVLDQWPELSETFVVNELAALRRLGHDVRVQAFKPAAHANPEAPGDIDVHLLARDGRERRVRDLLWLVAHRPLACARDLAGRRRWRREEWARRCGAARPRGAADRSRAATSTCTRTSPPARRSTPCASPRSPGARSASPPTPTTSSCRRATCDEKLERADSVFTGCDYNVAHLREHRARRRTCTRS